MKKAKSILTACLLVCIGASAVRVKTLYPVDAMVRGDSPETRYGEFNLMMLRHQNDTSGSAYGLVKFDLSSIPSNAVIRSAEVDFYLCVKNWPETPSVFSPVALFENTEEWNAETVTFNTAPGHAATAVQTLLHFGDGTAFTGEFTLSSKAAGWLAFNSSGVIRLLQGWVDGTVPNNGFALAATGEFLPDQRCFQIASADHANPAVRPKLVVKYTVSDRKADSDRKAERSPALRHVAEPADGRPNIIWIMAEDMSLDLECYGMKDVHTPHLNRLAQEGALYTRAYCSNPICSPSRSAMMTGVDQTRINAQHHRSNRNVPLPTPYKPITYWLRRAGYTCILGNENVRRKGRKIDCNFKTAALGPYDGKTTFGLFDKFDDFMPDDQPFFAQIQLLTTHRGSWWNSVRENALNPVDPDTVKLPPFFADTPEIRYDWAAYCDQINYMDKEVGVLMNELKSKGLDRNTVVIFIADNGRCNLRGKGYLYESGIHIPLIVWAPGRIRPGTVVDDLVLTTDISASILKLAGAGIPDYMTAKPFIGEGGAAGRISVRSARDIWDEIDECSRSITTRRYAYIKNYMPEVPWATDQAYLELNRPALWVMRRLKAEGKLSPNEMLFFRDRKPPEELYDLAKDPDQLHNLADNPEYASVLEQMREQETLWEAGNKDCGLEDLGKRTTEKGLAAVKARTWAKIHQPEQWKRLESGELMATDRWMQKAGKATK